MYIMNKSTKKGRKLAIIAILVFLGFPVYELITYGLYIWNVGYDRLVSQSMQVVFSAFVALYFYKGNRWARVLIGIVLILNAISYLMRIIEAVVSAVPTTWFLFYIVFALIVNCIVGIVVLTSRDIKSFMEFQRNKRLDI